MILLCSERPFSALEASCNFEEDLCNFYQDKEGSGWTRAKVKPNMFQAGDHTSGLGKSEFVVWGVMVGGGVGVSIHAPFPSCSHPDTSLKEGGGCGDSCEETKTIGNLGYDHFSKLEFKLLC